MGVKRDIIERLRRKIKEKPYTKMDCGYNDGIVQAIEIVNSSSTLDGAMQSLRKQTKRCSLSNKDHGYRTGILCAMSMVSKAKDEEAKDGKG